MGRDGGAGPILRLWVADKPDEPPFAPLPSATSEIQYHASPLPHMRDAPLHDPVVLHASRDVNVLGRVSVGKVKGGRLGETFHPDLGCDEKVRLAHPLTHLGRRE